jgi:ATP-dependent helicase STH1/SNF2
MYRVLTFVPPQRFFNQQYEKELSEHHELADLEDGGSTKAASAAPSTGAGTPQPTSNGPTRIKLVSNSNGASLANGGSSGVQSDEE